jgi:hypothetical protein
MCRFEAERTERRLRWMRVNEGTRWGVCGFAWAVSFAEPTGTSARPGFVFGGGDGKSIARGGRMG